MLHCVIKWCWSGDIVISMAFFGVFLYVPLSPLPPRLHLFTPSFLGKWKVLKWYISGPCFIYFWLAVPKFSKFKGFRSSRKLNFRLPTLYVGDKHHPFPLCLCATEVKLLNNIKNILTFKAVSKLLLGYVKVEKYC